MEVHDPSADDGFKVVSKKRRPQSRNGVRPNAAAASNVSTKLAALSLHYEDASVAEIEVMLQKARLRIQRECGHRFLPELVSELGQQISRRLPTLELIVCYALGSFSQSSDWSFGCRLQLILLQELATSLQAKVEIYDPAFTNTEKQFLTSETCRFAVIDRNEECKRIATEPTLFFMLHANFPLYRNLYAVNIEASTSQNVVLLGNPMDFLATELPAVFSRLESHPIRVKDSLFREALSDTYLTFVRREDVPGNSDDSHKVSLSE